MNKEYNNDKAFEDYEKTLLAIQRHKICEKISEFVERPENFKFFDLYIGMDNIRKLIDQIERGEEDDNDRND